MAATNWLNFFSLFEPTHRSGGATVFHFRFVVLFFFSVLLKLLTVPQLGPQDEPNVQLEELLAECFTSLAGIVGGTRKFDLDLIEGNCRDVS